MLKKINVNVLSLTIVLLHLINSSAVAQVDSVYWDFGTTGLPIIEATNSSNANVQATNCIADTGNVCCTPFTYGGYTIPYLTTQYSSTGVGAYVGASGQPTLRNNCKSGSFNASTSTYLSFTVTPNGGYAITIEGIEFGAQGVFFGTSGYTIRTSVDGFSTNVGSGSLGTDYGGSKKSHTGLSIVGAQGAPIEVRIYGHGGYFTSTTGDFFIDDVVLFYEASLGASCSMPDTPGSITYSNLTFYSVLMDWHTVSNAISYEYAFTTIATPPSFGANVSDTVLYESGLDGNTLYYFHVRSMCDTFASDWVTTSFTTNVTPVCDTPANLTASNLTTSSANLEWDSVSGSLGYEIALTSSASPPANGGVTADTTYTASYLDDNTTYYFHLRNTCLDTFLYSDWVTIPFTTIEDTTTDTFTVVTYNLLNYGGSGRTTEFRTVMDSIDADIVVVQELTSSAGFNNFRSNILNHSSAIYTGATFINGYDTDNGLYYKSTKFDFISNTAISTSLRDINQFMMRHKPSGDTLIIYSVHLKAGSSGSDATQRAGEVDDLRTVTNALGSGKYFLVCGDFNIYGSSESAYQKLTQNGSNANGKFNDIISLTGTWNNSSYAIHHTQSPRTTSFGGGATGGLDDRFDMFLFSNAIVSTGGFDILSGSYLSFGNDGQHYNSALNTPPYTAYPSSMLSAIHDASDHLPVVVRIRYNSAQAKAGRVLAVNNLGNSFVEEKLLIYPNPAREVIYIKSKANVNRGTALHLYDMQGKVVRMAHLSKDQGAIVEVRLSGLAAGMYYLKADGFHEVYKVIVR